MKRKSGFFVPLFVLAVMGVPCLVTATDGTPTLHPGGITVCGEGTDEPAGYVPVMLSNGSLCMTADFLGGVPSDATRKRKYDITRGIFLVGKRFGGQGFQSPHGIQVEAFNFGSFALKVSVDGKRCGAPDRWSQTFDPLIARSITTNVFGNVTRVAETFVAPDEDTIVVRQTFPGADMSRIDAGLNYIIHNSERFHGKWTTLPDGCAFDYTALGLSTYKGRITVRHAKEDGAFVSFISFGKPYMGTYADISAKHAASWNKYYSVSEVYVPDAEIMRMRRVAEYQLKCCTTKWSIPPGIPPSHWSAGIFAFDEMYAVQGLLSAGHFDEARRASDYRFRTLGTAKNRLSGTGAKWVWISMETNPDDCAKNGFWLEHIFHMSAVARSCRLVASYTDDLDYLRAKAYPVIRECARFFRNHCIYDMPDGSSFVCKCTDLERLRAGRERPFMTTCGAIDTLRTAADAADLLGVDAKDSADWRMTADRLLKSLPVKDGRFVPAANSMDAVSMGTLAGYFPFPIFPKGHKEQTAAVDYFLEHGAAGGNMYSTGKKICPWYCGTMAMAALRAGRGEKAIALMKNAGASSGVWGEYWEINEGEKAWFRPWFLTSAANCLSAINSMLLMEADGECRIGAGVPKEWKDWSFRLPAEGGYEVDFAMKDGKVTRLVLRGRRVGDAAPYQRTVNLVLPDGSRRKVTFDNKEVIKVDCRES